MRDVSDRISHSELEAPSWLRRHWADYVRVCIMQPGLKFMFLVFCPCSFLRLRWAPSVGRFARQTRKRSALRSGEQWPPPGCVMGSTRTCGPERVRRPPPGLVEAFNKVQKV